MRGYLQPQFKIWEKSQKRNYKAIYCGLCRSIRENYGLCGIFGLGYEMATILLLCLAVQEKVPRIDKCTCSLTPFSMVNVMEYHCDIFKKAAVLSELVLGYELYDNLKDRGNVFDHMVATLFNTKMKKSKDIWPEAVHALNEQANRFATSEATEYSFNVTIAEYDKIFHMIGLYMLPREIVGEEKKDFLSLVIYLGRWIYLIDAVDDYYKDQAQGEFNIFHQKDAPHIEKAEEVLKSILGEIAVVLSRLPIKRYQDELSILLVRDLRIKTEEKICKLRNLEKEHESCKS